MLPIIWSASDKGEVEEAFFGLIEADPAVLPILVESFVKVENRGIRADLVRCIWQQRRPDALGFLAEVLHDPEPAVWKEALDGLVCLGGDQVIKALQTARTTIAAVKSGRGIKVEWVDEALEQLRGHETD